MRPYTVNFYQLIMLYFLFQVIELKRLVEELCERDGKKYPMSFVSSVNDASRGKASDDAQRQSKDLLVKAKQNNTP